MGLFSFINWIFFMSNLMSNYYPLEVTFVKGRGCWLTDTSGNEYLDALSGIGVVNLGHSHPAITKSIVDQSKELLHTSNVYRIANQEKLFFQTRELKRMKLP
jgi:acetylornithine/N-succinyldiaminopimelate aminotransferase